MILLWFVLGIILILCIARYNESNKLFWTLLLSYILGFAGAKAVYDTVNSSKAEHSSFIQTNSTQVSVLAQDQFLSCTEFVIGNTDEVVTEQVPVSQSYLFGYKTTVNAGTVLGRSRDQPNKKVYLNSS